MSNYRQSRILVKSKPPRLQHSGPLLHRISSAETTGHEVDGCTGKSATTGFRSLRSSSKNLGSSSHLDDYSSFGSSASANVVHVENPTTMRTFSAGPRDSSMHSYKQESCTMTPETIAKSLSAKSTPRMASKAEC